MFLSSLILLPTLLAGVVSGCQQKTLTILALGDSLTAGYGLAADEAFPVQLEAHLRMRGYRVRLINAGVSGDTTEDGLLRLESALHCRPDLAIVELGANDALQMLDVRQAKANLAAILSRMQSAGIPVILAGMKAPPYLGAAYVAAFDPIFPQLAEQFGVPLYPFFLAGVAGRPELNLADGIHPTAAGIEIIVSSILPLVEQELERLNR